MPVRHPLSKLASGDKSAGAAAKHDGATGGAAEAPILATRCGWVGLALHHLLDRVREADLVELILGENDLSVRANENAPGNPAVREDAKPRAVTVGDHGKLEAVLLLPGTASDFALERTDIDDLEPLLGEALVKSENSRRLLPTALSGRLPEDQEHPAGPLDRQPNLGKRDRRSRLDARKALNDLHRSTPSLHGRSVGSWR